MKYAIKKQNIWKKRFSKEELNLIWEAFSKISPYIDNSLKCNKGKDLDNVIINTGYFIHPESDYENNTLGVEPKSLQKCFKKINGTFSLDSLTDLFFVVNMAGILSISYNNRFIDREVMQIDWDEVVKEIVIGGGVSEEITAEELIYMSIEKTLVFLGLSHYKEELSFIYNNLWTLALLTPEFINKYNSIGEFLSQKETQWKEVFKFVPKVQTLVAFVKPQNFSLSYIKMVKEVYGKELKDMPYIQQLKVVLNIMRNPIESAANIKYISWSNSYTERIAMLSDYVTKNLSEKTLENVSYNIIANAFENLSEEYADRLIKRVNKLAKSNNFRNIDLIMQFFRMVGELNNSELTEFAFNLPNSVVYSAVEEYGIDNLRDYVLYEYKAMWDSRPEKRDIPNIKYTEGKYTIEVLDNDDYEALILGQVTDCCQVVEGAGYSCLKAGMKYASQGFVKVTKNNQIYAQSWFWTAELEEKKVLCFDSIEMLSDNLNQSQNILMAYEGLTKKLLEQGYADIIVAGNDGYVFPEELQENYTRKDNYNLYNQKLRFKEGELQNYHVVSSIYTDTVKLGQAVLGKK